jgi:DNA-binding CsgD family transcriptional regulator
MKNQPEKFNTAEFRDFLKQLYLKEGKTVSRSRADRSEDRVESRALYDSIDRNSSHGDCLYLVDFLNQVIPFRKGFKDLLGYDDDEVSLELILESLHPDDVPLVEQVVKTALVNSIDSNLEASEPSFMMTCRQRKKDGSYLHVLVQSLELELNPDGMMTRSLMRVSDISFLQLSAWVRWTFDSPNVDQVEFNAQVMSGLDIPFTSREIEVIRAIEKQMTNEQIAKELHISKHTVATHRKNILKKCNRNNSHSLLEFCRQRGVI